MGLKKKLEFIGLMAGGNEPLRRSRWREVRTDACSL
jgi:hypothetical protein